MQDDGLESIEAVVRRQARVFAERKSGRDFWLIAAVPESLA
jgi:hypothetical protein